MNGKKLPVRGALNWLVRKTRSPRAEHLKPEAAMNYRGVEVHVVSRIEGSFRWYFEFEGIIKDGVATEREMAVRHAHKAVDTALKLKPKRQPEMPHRREKRNLLRGNAFWGTQLSFAMSNGSTIRPGKLTRLTPPPCPNVRKTCAIHDRAVGRRSQQAHSHL